MNHSDFASTCSLCPNCFSKTVVCPNASCLSNFKNKHTTNIEKFVKSNGREPTHGEMPNEAAWLKRLRHRHTRQNNVSEHISSELSRIGVNVTAPKPTMKKSPDKNLSSWLHSISHLPSQESSKQMSDLKWCLSNFRVQNDARFKNMQECIVKQMSIGDIHPNQCSRNSPIHSMKFVLSYVIDPLIQEKQNISKWPMVCTLPGGSCLFHSDFIRSIPELNSATESLKRELPSWFWHAKKCKMNCKNAINVVKNNPDWFDRYPVSRRGQDMSRGFVCISQTRHASPRRMHLSSETHGKMHSSRLRCHTESLYYYPSNGQIPSCFMQIRCLRDHKHVALLGHLLWKHFCHLLSGPSQVCPPNGCDVLTHFGSFKGKISSHRDNSPCSTIKIDQNSQILGTSVMVFSIGDTQDVIFSRIGGATNEDITFEAKDCSFYILNPIDDFCHHHRTQFHGGNSQKKNQNQSHFQVVGEKRNCSL